MQLENRHNNSVLFFFIAVPTLGIILIMFGTELTNLQDGTLGYSYGLVALCLILTLAVHALLGIERCVKKRRESLNGKPAKVKQYDYKVPLGTDNPAFASSEYSGSAYTSELQLTQSSTGSLNRGISQSLDLSELSRNTGVTYVTHGSGGIRGSTQSLNVNSIQGTFGVNSLEQQMPRRKNSLLNSRDQIIINTISSSNSLSRVHVSAAVNYSPSGSRASQTNCISTSGMGARGKQTSSSSIESAV